VETLRRAELSPSQVTIILEPIGNFVNPSIVGISFAFGARAQNAHLPFFT
jgi:hypothetical protein